jgi:hypothetical protein
MLAVPARRETMPKHFPVGRPEASYITGQILLLDGGSSAY